MNIVKDLAKVPKTTNTIFGGRSQPTQPTARLVAKHEIDRPVREVFRQFLTLMQTSKKINKKSARLFYLFFWADQIEIISAVVSYQKGEIAI